MFLKHAIAGRTGSAFLCLRRGVSRFLQLFLLSLAFSLPTQRCFCLRRGITRAATLFSAYAEVFLSCPLCKLLCTTFLCLRRGVSHRALAGICRQNFSLPTQRCFLGGQRPPRGDQLFSAYAEVFPRYLVAEVCVISFLCLRRGVSLSTAPMR